MHCTLHSDLHSLHFKCAETSFDIGLLLTLCIPPKWSDLEQDEIEQFKREYNEAKSQVILVCLQLIDMVNTCEIKNLQNTFKCMYY